MAALIIWGKGGVMDFIKARREIHDLQAQIQSLQKENNALKHEIHRLKTDPKAYEGPARNQLFMKKPGEIILRLPPDKQKTNSPREGSGPPAGSPQ